MKLCWTILCAATLLAAAAAFANEKSSDRRESTAATDSPLEITGALTSESPVFDRGWNNIAPPDTNCSFPLYDSSEDSTFYADFCITSTDTEPISIVVESARTVLDDPVLTLYCDPFDPTRPLANAVFSDDDDGEGLMSAFTPADGLVLRPGAKYWLVLTTFAAAGAGDRGSFTVIGSANVVECSSVATQPLSWSALKERYR
jgi:hypothetical protein